MQSNHSDVLRAIQNRWEVLAHFTDPRDHHDDVRTDRVAGADDTQAMELRQRSRAVPT